jgi:VWFA-related protein
VLLIDSMNTPIATQRIVQMRMIDFVDKLTADKRVAVWNLSAVGRLSILQGFTSDHELLKAAINSKKITGQIPTIEDPFQDPINPTGLLTGGADKIVDGEAEAGAMRVQYTMTAMNQIARYLAGLPGRKNLIWFTGAFSLEFPPFQDGVAFPPSQAGAPNPPSDAVRPQDYDFTAAMKSVVDLLARAHVAVNPVDARGLVVPPNPQGFQGMNQHFINVDEHFTMEEIAEQTGGKAYYNSNDLGGMAADAVDLGSNFYTLTYTPVNQALDTRWREIKVKVDRPGLHLDYRNGYYAVEPDVTLAGKKIERVSPMQEAMMRGGLDATQILFKVAVQEAHGTEDKLAVDNQPEAKWMKPPYRRYTVSYVVDVHGIDFATSPDGNYRGDFEYGVRVYNADGDEVVNSVSKTVSPILPPAVYRSMLKGGANAHLEIDVPATGEYFLRIAVHDLASDRVGSIEVATSSIHAQTNAVSGK